MKQIQTFQKHWLQITSIVVCRLKEIAMLVAIAKFAGGNWAAVKKAIVGNCHKFVVGLTTLYWW